MSNNPLTPQDLITFTQASAQQGFLSPQFPPKYVFATDPVNFGTPAFRLFDAAFISTGIIDPNRLGTGATGAGNLYLADDGTWKPVGGGGGGGADMLKATYDVDNDGVVDSAERTEIIVRNSTGSTLTKGTIVYLSGATGNRPNAVRAQAHTEATSSKTIGMVEANIPNNSDGYVATNGTLHDLDTSAFTAGDAVWLSATTAGGITSTVPAEPNHAVFIGYIARAHPTQGRIVLHIQNGYEFDELHGVLLNSPANNDLVVYETSTTLWKNKSISTIFGGTPLITVPTLAQVTTAGNTTTNAITVGAVNSNGNVVIGGASSSGAFQSYNGFYAFSFGTSASAYNPNNNYTRIHMNASITYTDNFSGNFLWRSAGASVFEVANASVNFWNTSSVIVTKHNAATGNFLIGTTTDAGYKLDVNGTARVVGNFTTEGNIQLWGPSSSTSVKKISAYWNGNPYGLSIEDNASSVSNTGNGYGIRLGNVFSVIHTIGNYNQVNVFTNSFSPSSGIGTFSLLAVNGIINQTGGANGITRGIYVNPTITAAADFRAIETTVGNVLLATTSGNVAVGTTTALAKFTVAGSTTAASLLAQGVYFNNTLVAAANNDVLVGLDINPTFTNGAFTGVTNYAIRTIGDVRFQLAGYPLYGLNITNVITGETYISKTGASNLIIEGARGVNISPTNNVGIGILGSGLAQTKLSVFTSIGTSPPSLGSWGGTFSVVVGGTNGYFGLLAGVVQTTGDAWFQAQRVDATATAYNILLQPTGGNVLVGTSTNAGYKLDVVGADSRFNGVRVGLGAGGVSTNTVVGVTALDANTTGLGNTAIGYLTLKLNSTGSGNVAVGSQSLELNTSDNNTAIGWRASNRNTSGSNNNSLGYSALLLTTTGGSNVGIGSYALYSNTTSSNNIAVGVFALFNNTASNNTAVGYQAGYSNTSGTLNTLIGHSAGYNNTTAIGTTAIGHRALFTNSTGTENTAIGEYAMQANSTGNQNVSIGAQSMFVNSTGSDNTAIGYRSLQLVTSSNNTAIGSDSLQNTTTGGNNVAIGRQSLLSNTTGNYNTAIGFQAGQAGVANTTGTNNIFIGYQSTGVSATESNRTWIGNSSTTSTWLAGNVLIGTTTDAGYKLDVNGSVNIGSSSFPFASNLVTLTSNAGTSSLRIGGGNTLYVSGALTASNLAATDYVWVVRVLVGNGLARLTATTTDWLSITDSGQTANGSGNLSAKFATFGTTYATINASAQVEIASTTKGFLQPRMTNTQVLAITTPATGLQAYDTTNNKNLLYNGTAWQNIATETWVTAQGYTNNTGTVTSVATGTGLSGGTITGSGTIALANTAVTAGAYTNANITVDAQGRITAASNGSGGSTSTISIGATSSSNVYSSASVVGHMKFEYWSTDNPASGKQETGVLYVTYYPGPPGGFNYWLDVQTTTPDSTAPLSFTITGGPTLDINITNPNPYGVDITYKITTF